MSWAVSFGQRRYAKIGPKLVREHHPQRAGAAPAKQTIADSAALLGMVVAGRLA